MFSIFIKMSAIDNKKYLAEKVIALYITKKQKL